MKFFWLLLSASYGLVNANAKWQAASDKCMYEFGLQQLTQVPQLFYQKTNGELSLVAAKVVDDILISAPISRAKSLIRHIQSMYKLGTIVYGPTDFYFYGLRISQSEDMMVAVNAEDKLSSVTSSVIRRERRKQSDEKLNAIEMAQYMSINGKLVWLGVIGSPFSAFTASYLQQKAPRAIVRDLYTQNNLVKRVKELGTQMRYVRPNSKGTYELNIVSFADASKTADVGQLGMVTGLMLGDLKSGSIFHILTWFSKRSKRPVKSVSSAEVYASSSA